MTDRVQKLKEIVAGFLKTSPENINDGTLINERAIEGSIMVHRMYAIISRELGEKVVNYSKIKTFGDLLGHLDGHLFATAQKQSKPISRQPIGPAAVIKTGVPLAIGIDLEDVDNLPVAVNYLEDPFYTDNFTSAEMDHCLRQPDPRSSFAGLFATKEAIIKADNTTGNGSLKNIEILHDKNGKPLFSNFMLSISHTARQAVAVAVKISPAN